MGHMPIHGIDGGTELCPGNFLPLLQGVLKPFTGSDRDAQFPEK